MSKMQAISGRPIRYFHTKVGFLWSPFLNARKSLGGDAKNKDFIIGNINVG